MIAVYDGVLADPTAYRQAALAREFKTVRVAPDTEFRGIAWVEDPALADWIAVHFPQLQPTLTFFRQSPTGQPEPNYIHTDCDMGEWTAVLYLTPDPPVGDGTTFWRHKTTGAVESCASDAQTFVDEQAAWRDLDQWQLELHVPAAFGRVVLFPAARFHSRALAENYGHGESARLIQVMFGVGALNGS